MLLDLLWLSVLGYVVLQVVVLLRSSGGSRVASALPLAVMVPIFGLTVWGLVQESNLWPLLLLFASPMALAYVVIVGLFLWAKKKQSPPGT